MFSGRNKQKLNREDRSESPGWELESRRLRVMKSVFLGALAALAVVVSIALWMIWTYDPAPPPPPRPVVWEWQDIMSLQETGGRVLGEYVRERHPEGEVVVLVPPEPAAQEVDMATLQGVLAGLRDGESGQVILQEAPGLQENDIPGMYLWFDAESFDTATEPHAEAAAVVSIMGLPDNPEDMQFWRRLQRPELMLINAEIFRLGRIIRQGMIEAVAVRDPAHDRFELSPESVDMEKLWMLITEDNLGEVKEKHPNLFIPEKEDRL